MKKITNQNWFSSIDYRYNDYLIDEKGRNYLLSNFYSKNLLSKSTFIRNEWYYGILRALKFQNSCAKFLKFILDIDFLLIKNRDNVIIIFFRSILDLIVIIFISFILLIIIVLFITIFPFYKFKQKNKNLRIDQKDLYFFDKYTAKHPLILKKEFIKHTSLSSNFIDVAVDKKVNIRDFCKILLNFRIIL